MGQAMRPLNRQDEIDAAVTALHEALTKLHDLGGDMSYLLDHLVAIHQLVLRISNDSHLKSK